MCRRPNGARAAILDNLLASAEMGQQEAVNTAMLRNLFVQGQRGIYVRKLQGLPI